MAGCCEHCDEPSVCMNERAEELLACKEELSCLESVRNHVCPCK